MFKHELKRAFFNKFFFLSIIVGSISGLFGLVSYYSDISFFKQTGNCNAISSYEAWIYCLSLGAGTIFRLIIPLLIAIPFTDTYLKDVKGGYIRYILTRCSFKKYFICKVTVNALVGGAVIVIPYFIWIIITGILFSMELPNTDLNYLPDGPLGFVYAEKPWIYIGFLSILGFLFGIIYSSLGLAISVITQNRFAVICFPFIFFLFLTIGSQIVKIKFLFPLILFAPYELNEASGSMIIAGFLCTFILVSLLLTSLFIKGKGDLI